MQSHHRQLVATTEVDQPQWTLTTFGRKEATKDDTKEATKENKEKEKAITKEKAKEHHHGHSRKDGATEHSYTTRFRQTSETHRPQISYTQDLIKNNIIKLANINTPQQRRRSNKVHYKGHTHTTCSVTEHECVTTSSNNNNEPFHNRPFFSPLAAFFTRVDYTFWYHLFFLTTCAPTDVFVNVTTCVSLAHWRLPGGSGNTKFVDCLPASTAVCTTKVPRFTTFVHSCPHRHGHWTYKRRCHHG